jgi:hypothetical protein
METLFMKKLLTCSLILVFFYSINARAQMLTVLTEKPSGYTADDAGKYAKLFGKKFMHENAWLGNFQNYSFSIEKWDVIKYPKSQEINYRVFIKLSWTEVDGMTTLDYEYKGALVFDQFGCGPGFFISYKLEPHLLGAGKRGVDIQSHLISKFQQICPNAQWMFFPEGCLDD